MRSYANRSRNSFRIRTYKRDPRGWVETNSAAGYIRLYNDQGARPKALRMILLRGHKNNRPGMILLQETRIAMNHPARITRPCPCKSFSNSMLREYPILKAAGAKGFRMISLCKCKNNCPGLILLQKNGGVLADSGYGISGMTSHASLNYHIQSMASIKECHAGDTIDKVWQVDDLTKGRVNL